MRRVLMVFVGVLAMSLGLGACGGGSAKKTASTTTTPSSTSSSTTTSTMVTTTHCLAGGTSGPFSAASPTTALMTDLVVQTDCADKVTFTFKPGTGVPGYEIAYKPGPFQDAGSGAPHPVSGHAFVVVRLHTAWIADFAQPSAPPTYRGPKSIHPTGTMHVQDTELVEAFEGYVTWVIGLDAQRPLAVTATESPPSLAVTVA